MPSTFQIVITDSSVSRPTCKTGDKVYWTNSSSASVTLSNLPGILSPTPPGSSITLAVNANSGNYTVNGSKGAYSYDISTPSPSKLPATGTIDIG